METDNTVSIWFGQVADLDDLLAYIDLSYDEEGDLLPSEFYQDFGVSLLDIDEDFTEANVLPEPSGDFSYLLAGVSYDKRIFEEIAKLDLQLQQAYNAIYLIYNYHYKGKIREGEKLTYIATLSYR